MNSHLGAAKPGPRLAAARPSTLPGGAPACSTNTTATPIWRAIQEQNVILTANYPRPERRSNHGRAILRGDQIVPEPAFDLVFLVELSGLEPLTSCMPWEMLTFNTGKC
jgi:hypothetical protein